MKKIFIVEDDPHRSDLVKSTLADIKELKLEFFNCVEACLQKKSEPSVILLRFCNTIWSSNRFTSHEALNRIQQTFKHAKVVLLSDNSQHTLMEEYKKYRGVDYVLSRAEQSQFSHILRRKIK